jgi:peroxiredoxin family protein
VQSVLTIFLHSSRYDRVYQAVNLVHTACSMGWRCHLFLFYEALASFADGSWDEVNLAGKDAGANTAADELAASTLGKLQRGFELSNAPSLYHTLDAARSDGCLVCACSASVKLLGLDPRDIKERLDEIVGLPTMLQIAGKSTHTFYL